MSTTPTLKVTLAHISGAVSSYKQGTSNNSEEHGGLREAIVTCFSGHGDWGTRVELLRADIPGANWAALDRAGAFPALQERLHRAAIDLLDGRDPHVVVTLNAVRSLSDAHLVTNGDDLASELMDSSKRSLAVPRILPYQLGGGELGATAVVYSPVAGGGLRLHSLHPNDAEALMAESVLKSQGELKTGLLKVHTTVTTLIAAVGAGDYRPEQQDRTAPALTPAAQTHSSRPGLMPSPLAAPSPFNQ